MATAVATRAAAVCGLCAILLSCSVPTASGAWPWEVVPQKNKTATTEAPVSNSPNVTTGAPNTTTLTPISMESTPRLRSRPRSNPRKHHLHTSTTPQSATKNNTANTTTTTEAPPPAVPPVAVQNEPQLFASVQPQLPAAPLPEMSPIVIVEPDSYTDAGRAYRSMYEQPYSGMYPPPMTYAPQLPFYAPAPPPPLPPYPSPYDMYSFGGYPSYQWPAIAPSYLRPYRSYPSAPVPPLGSYPNDYPPYPWWQGPTGGAAPAVQGGCSSEAGRDREELTPAVKDAPVDQKVQEPSPTYVSLLPSYTAKVGSLDIPKSSTRDETTVRIEKPYVVEQKVELPNTATGNNAYGMGETVGRENHILRNNPYQPAPPSPFWPGYYEQNQWPQWNQWQQWPGLQQAQYPYGVGPQQPTVAQKRETPAYWWGGRQYA